MSDLDVAVSTAGVKPSEIQLTEPEDVPILEPRAGNLLFFDLETVPDETPERMKHYDLETVSRVSEIPFDHMPAPDDFIDQYTTVPRMKAYLNTNIPDERWLLGLIECEDKRPKGPRATLLDMVDDLRKKKTKHVEVDFKNNKKMSTTPEYCRIAAMSWAVDSDPVSAIVTREHPRGPHTSEPELLEMFWAMAEKAKLVGYNCKAFDLPVIFARSIILGVEPSRQFSLSKGTREIFDLWEIRGGWKGMSLKAMCALYGIKMPFEGGVGQSVYGWWQEPRMVERIRRYAASDVIGTRELFRKWEGVWF